MSFFAPIAGKVASFGLKQIAKSAVKSGIERGIQGRVANMLQGKNSDGGRSSEPEWFPGSGLS